MPTSYGCAGGQGRSAEAIVVVLFESVCLAVLAVFFLGILGFIGGW